MQNQMALALCALPHCCYCRSSRCCCCCYCCCTDSLAGDGWERFLGFIIMIWECRNHLRATRAFRFHNWHNQPKAVAIKSRDALTVCTEALKKRCHFRLLRVFHLFIAFAPHLLPIPQTFVEAIKRRFNLKFYCNAALQLLRVDSANVLIKWQREPDPESGPKPVQRRATSARAAGWC